jgi:Ca2+-binding EF-hand superfamily protein
MGQKITKNSITELDFEILCRLSGKTQQEIEIIYDDFLKNNPSGKLYKENFADYYKHFRTEENVSEIAQHCFRAFDLDKNGYVDFNEFLIALVATTNGEAREKLKYAFAVYDLDNDKVLNEDEIRQVLKAMFSLLNMKNSNVDMNQCLQNVMNSLDVNKDKKISIGEFIDGILEDSVLQALMSPFSLNDDEKIFFSS